MIKPIDIILILICLLYLSSPVPAAQHKYAGVTTQELILMAGEPQVQNPKPVPYLYYDTSVALEGWHVLYQTQMSLAVYTPDKPEIDLTGIRIGIGMALLTIGVGICAIVFVTCMGQAQPIRSYRDKS